MTSAITSPYPLVPAPWHCKGEIYWIFLNPSKSLEPGAYAPLEAEAPPVATDEVGSPTGKGVGACVMVMRYSDTPAGPYDELTYIPGAFTSPEGHGDGEPHLRITRIYVSENNPALIYNSRLNWNVPKHPARFEFEELSNSETKISVYPPVTNDGATVGESTDVPPIFSAVVSKAANFLPSIPFSTTFLPFDTTVVLPPLPTSPSHPAIIGTDSWKSFSSVMRGKVRFIWVKPGEIKDADGIPQFGDGVEFPKIKPWSLGMYWLPGTTFEISTAELLTNEDKKTL
ncbi:hypothetical protein SCHPADRAFT_157044 [Schizopora paradoxa]|uniref:Acetoacetate decarboxylase n=1 Tax=Schizopora paradoxa TaxID=27342 RepID=A0A0H2S107_9AGAM|nr:hypothetical protein SCHPADRAFT_157044 [Schizopora paradoxa]